MTDVAFGDAATVRNIDLADGAVATLVRLPAESNQRGAILLVHGFADYFFRTELTERQGDGHAARRGIVQQCAQPLDQQRSLALELTLLAAAQGIDHGRSLRPGQLPNYVTELRTHFAELDEAVRLIRGDGHDRLVVLGHSTGGLITALWAHEHRADPPMDALALNSPWLDLAEPWLTRTVGMAGVRLLGRFAPRAVLRPALGGLYGRSIHRDHHGEWDYDLELKPLNAFPVRAGWLRAIHLGHRRVHHGLAIPVPVLVLHSTRSLLRAPKWTEDAMRADTVLDVDQIARWAPRLGPSVRVVPIPGALHDVFLSVPAVRERAQAELAGWLDSVAVTSR